MNCSTRFNIQSEESISHLGNTVGRYDALYLSFISQLKGKVVYNPLRLGTVIVLVSSGMDFVNTPRLYSDRATS